MICSSCLIDKDVNLFTKRKDSKTGYRRQCKDCINLYQREYYSNNTEAFLERKRKYRQTEKYKINNKIYNKRYEKEYYTMRKINRVKNLKTRLSMTLRDMIRRCLKGTTKNTNTFILLGYDTLKLKQRIEMQFKDGMSWDNYGKWHIDHKKPISKFRKGTSIKIINSLSNLQPLWAKDNLSKGNRF